MRTRTILFSDVHGNLPALEAMLAHAGPADGYVCLGDVVNYGPWADECVERIAGLKNCRTLMGNHERAFLDGVYPGEHPVARAFFEFCYPRFRSRESLSAYGECCEVGSYCAVHTLNDSYIFADTAVQIDRNYLIGHSHHQFARKVGCHRLINVGSVGQNRRDLSICNYAVHDSVSDEVQLVACPHDAGQVIARMQKLGYPSICIEYYLVKTRNSRLPSPPEL